MNNYGPNTVNHIMGEWSNPCITSANICRFQYYREILATKIISLFRFTMPDTWPEFAAWWLILDGWYAVVRTSEFGVIPIQGTLSGTGIWNQPNEILIAQPLVYFRNPLRIGVDVSAVRMSPFYTGASRIINHYAALLTLTDDAISANLINSRIGHVFVVNGAGPAKTVRKVFDNIANGEPAVIDVAATKDFDGKSFEMLGKPGDHVITDTLLENRRAIIRDFCRDVGIMTGNEDKRERLTQAEVEVGGMETERLLSYWLRHIQSSIDETNRLFGLELGVSLDGNYAGRNIDASSFPSA